MSKPINLLILDAPQVAGDPETHPLEKAGLDPRIQVAGGEGFDMDEALAQADAILTWRCDIDTGMIEKARRCQIIVHYGPGAGPDVAKVDHTAARRLGIYVTSIPDWAPGEWADLAMGLMGKLFERHPIPPREAKKPSLKKLRLGLVGLGGVGREVARRASDREMEVWACDPFAKHEYFQSLSVHTADLDELMGICDIISLHVPLVPITRGMIGQAQLALLKKTALLVNSSSPELIDLEALALSLERGHPAGVAFGEDLGRYLPATHRLFENPAMIQGPSTAGTTEASRMALRQEAGRLLGYVWKGNRPPHLLIDPPCPRQVLSIAGHDWS